MLDFALDQNSNRFVHFITDYFSAKRAVQIGFTHEDFTFWLSMVFTRAISRRMLRNWFVLLNCWVANCMRRPNCARRSSNSSCGSSAGFLSLNSFAFIVNHLPRSEERRVGKECR